MVLKKKNFTLVQIVSTPIDIASPTLNELNVVLYLTTSSYEEFAIYTVWIRTRSIFHLFLEDIKNLIRK